jgi:hypothetical protein
MDRQSFRDLLLRHRLCHPAEPPIERRLLKEHIADDAREQLAKKVLEHLDLSGFEIDEERQVMRKRDGGRGW